MLYRMPRYHPSDPFCREAFLWLDLPVIHSHKISLMHNTYQNCDFMFTWIIVCFPFRLQASLKATTIPFLTVLSPYLVRCLVHSRCLIDFFFFFCECASLKCSPSHPVLSSWYAPNYPPKAPDSLLWSSPQLHSWGTLHAFLLWDQSLWVVIIWQWVSFHPARVDFFKARIMSYISVQKNVCWIGQNCTS